MNATIVLHRSNVYFDINALTYKLAETTIQDSSAGDKVASDTDDTLDGPILARMCDERYSKLLRRLDFCLTKEYTDNLTVDDALDDTYCFEFDFTFAHPVSKQNLTNLKNFLHDYIVKGVLLDWYTRIGVGLGQDLATELVSIENSILSIANGGGFIKHPGYAYMPSYKIR